MENIKKILKGDFKTNVSLKNFSWFKTGGNAKYFFEPYNLDDLIVFLQNKPSNLPIFILGAGSNILIDDNGFNGIVIRLNAFNKISYMGNAQIYAEAGAFNLSVANFAKDCLMENDLGVTCFEFLSGIPGSIGGGIYMNAGAFGGEFKDILSCVTALDLQGNIHEFAVDDLGLSYRANALPKQFIFIGATFTGKIDSKNIIIAKMTNIKNTRELNQPQKVRTGGSTFANPAGNKKAWELLDAVGMRGYRIGGAYFSDKHCNFLINDNNATSSDIENLIQLAKQRVNDQFSIELHTEIKIIS